VGFFFCIVVLEVSNRRVLSRTVEADMRRRRACGDAHGAQLDEGAGQPQGCRALRVGVADELEDRVGLLARSG